MSVAEIFRVLGSIIDFSARRLQLRLSLGVVRLELLQVDCVQVGDLNPGRARRVLDILVNTAGGIVGHVLIDRLLEVRLGWVTSVGRRILRKMLEVTRAIVKVHLL